MLAREQVRAIHAHLLSHLQFIVHRIVYRLVWSNHVDSVQVTLMTTFRKVHRASLVGTLLILIWSCQSFDQELGISLVAYRVRSDYILFILFIVPVLIFLFVIVILIL